MGKIQWKTTGNCHEQTLGKAGVKQIMFNTEGADGIIYRLPLLMPAPADPGRMSTWIRIWFILCGKLLHSRPCLRSGGKFPEDFRCILRGKIRSLLYCLWCQNGSAVNRRLLVYNPWLHTSLSGRIIANHQKKYKYPLQKSFNRHLSLIYAFMWHFKRACGPGSFFGIYPGWKTLCWKDYQADISVRWGVWESGQWRLKKVR